MANSTFEQLDLHPRLVNALTDAGYTRPTQVQQAVIEVALEQRDILAGAPTGTGKTAAYLLPALQHLLDFPRKKPGPPRILVMVPTRELAAQVHSYAEKLCKHTSLKCEQIIGGVNYGQHANALNNNCDMVVATPGRLLEYIDAEVFDCRAVEVLVLDEADRMLDMGFRTDMERVAGETRWRKQTMLLSATLEGSGVNSFAHSVLEEPESIEVDPPRREKGKIKQWVHLADNWPHKMALLKHLLQEEPERRCIVFVKTRDRLMAVTAELGQAGIKHCWLRGEMPQDRRNAAIASFRSGEVDVLIATDVAARGLDIVDLSHVINFDMPRTADVYVHRIGRTGRGGRKGNAISLVEAHEVEMLGKVERYTEQKLPRRVVKELRPKHKEATAPAKKKKPSSASAVGKKKKASDKISKPATKKKQRLRDRKSIGKRRAPSAKSED